MHRPRWHRWAYLLSPCAVVLAGCGTRDAATADAAGADAAALLPFSTGLDPKRLLKDLTQGELDESCARAGQLIQVAAERSLDLNCRSTAVLAAKLKGGSTDAELHARCQMVFDQCHTTPHWRVIGTCSVPSSNCTAKVADVEVCVNDEVGYFSKLGSDLPTCAELTKASIDALNPGVDPTQLVSCTTLQACRGLKFLGGGG